MKTILLYAAAISIAFLTLTDVASAQGAKPLRRCPRDSVVSGTVCMDKYEASVWHVPDPDVTNKALVQKIRQGRATVAELTARGATQLGVTSDDYAACTDSGWGCTNEVFAVSAPDVIPSQYATWFQAQQACRNSRKRLPSNAEWQAAVADSPDPGPDNGTTDCHTGSVMGAVETGSRSSCASSDGAFDMVGNLYEWVADWMPRSKVFCGEWGGIASTSDDWQCLVGAELNGEPGALLRGGGFVEGGATAGPISVVGSIAPSFSGIGFGFRCAR